MFGCGIPFVILQFYWLYHKLSYYSSITDNILKLLESGQAMPILRDDTNTLHELWFKRNGFLLLFTIFLPLWYSSGRELSYLFCLHTICPYRIVLSCAVGVYGVHSVQLLLDAVILARDSLLSCQIWGGKFLTSCLLFLAFLTISQSVLTDINLILNQELLKMFGDILVLQFELAREASVWLSTSICC